MSKRVVVPRLPDATVVKSAPGETVIVDPPAVTAIRLAYGVGPGSGAAPTDDASFKSTYHVAIPVFSIGGLDPDGVYEFDAANLFDVIVKRSLRRKWGVRLELELAQESKTVGGADIYVETPFPDEPDAPTMSVLGRTGLGTTLPGGGRRVVLATSIITDAKRVGSLSGIYSIQLRDTAPDSDEKPRVRSLARGINVDVTRFEFEG
jgi:hypothetical protein